MREDDIVDGVEGIHPLALRTQNLLEQAEVLDSQGDLPGAALHELEFFRRPLASAGMADHQQPDRRLVADDRCNHKLANLLDGETLGGLGGGVLRFLRLGSTFLPEFRNVIGDCGKAGVAQELPRKSGSVCGDEMAAFHQPEPARADAAHFLQLFHRALYDTSVLLGAGNAFRH